MLHRLWHKLTAHHWRHNRRSAASSLAICECGWNCRTFRRIAWAQRRAALLNGCWLRGHAWGPVEDVHRGPVGFEESDDTRIGGCRQCDRCYATENMHPPGYPD